MAKVWQCSLPTVKRQLGNEELPVSRLLSLLEWLDLSLSDLQRLSEADSLTAPRYSARQIEFLSKNLREFGFLMKLYERMTPAQIAKKYKIDASTLERILIQLEKFDLIRVTSTGQVKPAFARAPGLDGALALATVRRQIDSMGQYSKVRIEHTIAQRERGVKTPPGQYSWSLCEVSEASYREFLKNVIRLLENFEQQSKIDEQMVKKSDLKKAVISFGAQLEELDSPHLQLITEIFAPNIPSNDLEG